MALPIWALYMKRVYEDPELDFPVEYFEAPPGYEPDIYCGPGELQEESPVIREPQNKIEEF
jgi:hypothetical protein